MNEAIALLEQISGRTLDVARGAGRPGRPAADERRHDAHPRRARLAAAGRRSRTVSAPSGSGPRLESPPDERGPIRDPGVEREIDLGRWKDAVRRALVDRRRRPRRGRRRSAPLYSLSRRPRGRPRRCIAPGQPFSPNGAPVLSYLSSQRAIDTLANSETTLAEVSAKTGMPVDELEGYS